MVTWGDTHDNNEESNNPTRLRLYATKGFYYKIQPRINMQGLGFWLIYGIISREKVQGFIWLNLEGLV